jgi:hypothetical protein
MLIRTSLIAAAAAIGLSSAAMADGSKVPTILDDQALDSVVAGAKLTILEDSLDLVRTIGVNEPVLNEALDTADAHSDEVVVVDYDGPGRGVIVRTSFTGIVVHFE